MRTHLCEVSELKVRSRVLTLSIVVIVLLTIPIGYSTTTTLGFNLGQSVHVKGGLFTVNLTVSNVVDLNSINVAISFDNEILNCVGMWGWNASDSIFGGHNIILMGPIINNALGTIMASCGLDWGVGVSGSGKLCTIQFQAVDLGVSQLSFMNVMKLRPDGTYLRDTSDSTILFEPRPGIAEVVGSDFQQNIFDVTQDMEVFHVVMHTNSTVTNPSFNHTGREMIFNINAADLTTGADIVEIPKPLLDSSLVVLLDGVAIETYFSVLTTLPENETCCFIYFTYTHSTRNVKIRLTLEGDITGDRKVNVKDVALAASAYGATPGSPGWYPLADVDKNHKINVKDVTFTAMNYGKVLQL
jgi:hypothetical protein